MKLVKAFLSGISLIYFVLSTSGLVQAEEVSTSSGSRGVSLTIYNQDFAVVKDVRQIDLKDGENYLRFEDVAANIDPTTVSFKSLSNPDAVVVKEQNYDHDLITPTSILSKSVGKQVKFRNSTVGGQVHEISGTLLSAPSALTYEGMVNAFLPYNSGLVLQTADGIVLNPIGQAEVASMPTGLRSKPSLLWRIDSTVAGSQQAEIAYRTSGLNWNCDYVAQINSEDNRVDLTAWVTIDNRCGATFDSASVKLLAGNVHRVQINQQPQMMVMGSMKALNARLQPQVTEESFSEYHLYKLPGVTDVKDNEIKQVSLLSADAVPCTKLLVYEPVLDGSGNANSESNKVKVKLEMMNGKENHLGLPLPAGRVRVYKNDADGALQFIGEDKIEHTAKDEKIRIYLGDAFDIVGEHKQTNVQEVSNKVRRLSYEISLRNHKDNDEKVTCVEHASGQWKVLESSLPFTKKDASTFEFAPAVPANGETKITYTLEERL